MDEESHLSTETQSRYEFIFFERALNFKPNHAQFQSIESCSGASEGGAT
jgi:hypothetical protein